MVNKIIGIIEVGMTTSASSTTTCTENRYESRVSSKSLTFVHWEPLYLAVIPQSSLK